MRLAAAGLATAAFALVAAQPAPADFALRGEPVQGSLIFGTAPAGTQTLTLDGKPVPLSAGGAFVIGFDRDRTGSALLEARLADGRAVRRTLEVAPRHWAIEEVNVALRPEGVPDAEFLRIRKDELARIVAARAVRSDSDGWRQHFIWPAHGRISGVFGSQRIYRGQPGSFHAGLDIAPGAGAAVVAPADGVVVLAGPPAFTLEGNLVIVDHGNGLNSAFLHLSSEAVKVGDHIRQGQTIGTVGMTGRATGPHLHWAVKWQDARIDPATLVPPQAP
ncbi:MAG TPA: M23 family metallopeptidase [Allosphingosinicella sp.]|jgi:murein DD-endopeptidase MepM/ murein hydrolase activator NlpD|nr:M23 family metallopeptidase [Allosphingosinicella sp.]